MLAGAPRNPSSGQTRTAMPSPLAFASSVNSDVKEKSRPRKLRWGTAEAYSAPAAPASPETSHSVDEDAEDGHDEERTHGDTLAITASKGKVGCCFYEFDTGKLLFIKDQQDSTSWDLTTLSRLPPGLRSARRTLTASARSQSSSSCSQAPS